MKRNINTNLKLNKIIGDIAVDIVVKLCAKDMILFKTSFTTKLKCVLIVFNVEIQSIFKIKLK